MRTAPLKELVQPSGRRAGEDVELPVYSVTKHAGFVPSLEYFKKQVFSRDTKSYKVVEPGDFAYATIHLDEGSIGIAPARGLISPMYTVFRPIESLVDPSFLIRFLKSPRALTYYPSLGKGAVHRRKSISLTALGTLPVPTPPLAEQRRIAAILDHADALRSKRRQILAHLDDLAQSIFHDMFGDVVSTMPLSDVVEEFRYGSSNKSGAEGYPALRIPNIIGGAIDTSEIKTVLVDDAELRRLELQDGDVLFVRTNGNPVNVGRSAVFTPKAVAHAPYENMPWIYASYLIRARLTDQILPHFLATFLASSAGRHQLRARSKTSAGQYNINTAALASIKIPVVSKGLQQAFASRVEKLDTQRASVQRMIAADDELFASLQSRAFRGEL